MTDIAPEKPADLQPQEPQGEQQEKMTRQQRRQAVIAQLEERLAAKKAAGQELTPRDKRQLDLLGMHGRLSGRQKNTAVDVNVDVDLTPDERNALIGEIGSIVGKKMLLGLQSAPKAILDKINEALPITIPFTVLGAGISNEFAQAYPKIAAIFAAGDDGVFMAAGATALCYIAATEGSKEEGYIRPLIDLARKHLEVIKESTHKKVQSAMLAAAFLGAAFALEDPEGLGRTITPILGTGLALDFFHHKVTGGASARIGLELIRRTENGEVVDLNDLSFLTSQILHVFTETPREYLANEQKLHNNPSVPVTDPLIVISALVRGIRNSTRNAIHRFKHPQRRTSSETLQAVVEDLLVTDANENTEGNGKPTSDAYRERGSHMPPRQQQPGR